MNRLGWALLTLFVVIGVGFALIVKAGHMKVAGPSPAPVAANPSALLIPVAGVPASALVDSFDDVRGGGARQHGAIDIMAPRGTPVLAAAPGTVAKLFESKDGGHTLYVASGDGGTVYYYAHLDAYAADIREGGAVARGEQIATVGSTGDADPSAPHLHFEVKRLGRGEKWWQGTEVDPYPLLGGR